MRENVYKRPGDSRMPVCMFVIMYRGIKQDILLQNLHLHLPVETCV